MTTPKKLVVTFELDVSDHTGTPEQILLTAREHIHDLIFKGAQAYCHIHMMWNLGEQSSLQAHAHQALSNDLALIQAATESATYSVVQKEPDSHV